MTELTLEPPGDHLFIRSIGDLRCRASRKSSYNAAFWDREEVSLTAAGLPEGLSLDAEAMGDLDEISKVDLGFPHDFLESEIPKELVYAEMFDQIDDHRGGTKR